MNFRPVARAAGAALVLAPAFLGAQTSTKVVNLGGQDYTMTAKSLVSAAGNINTDPRYQTPVSPAYNGVGSIRITATQPNGSAESSSAPALCFPMDRRSSPLRIASPATSASSPRSR
jgi:hypothetical protein